MQVQEILTAAIVFVPACYAAILAVQFASGLARLGKRPVAPAVTPIAPVEPQSASVEQMPDAIEFEGYCPEIVHLIVASIAPAAVEVVKPIALLPAFVPNHAGCTSATAEEAALVDAAAEAIAYYWSCQTTHNVVPFVRPHRSAQKPQQQHPALESMTLRAMRQLGAELRIKNARRWNTQQAIEALTRHYSNAV